MTVPDPEKAPEVNPLDNAQPLEASSADATTKDAHPQVDILPGDSATTQAEKVERQGHQTKRANGDAEHETPDSKRVKVDHTSVSTAAEATDTGRQKGVAPIKKEYLIEVSRTAQPDARDHHDDDAAEASGKQPETTAGRGGKKTKGGQNHARKFGSSRDAIELCKSRLTAREFEPSTCKFGDKCRFEHDIRKYLKDGKREDLQTFAGKCPIWEGKGKCTAGWQCRFASSHSKEIDHEDGRKELVLVEEERDGVSERDNGTVNDGPGVVNLVSIGDKMALSRKKVTFEKADKYLKWLNSTMDDDSRQASKAPAREPRYDNDGVEIKENRARYTEPPLRASEKRRIYYGRETPVLAPLTTQGNLAYRRLCVSLGAQVTWSEMAMGLPLISGEKGEWALLKAHESETTPPAYAPRNIVQDYDNSKDSKFGVQIAANKPWLALKTTEILTAYCPNLRAIDLNCGCPIDLVTRQGAGSALLDRQASLENTLRGMNAVSGEVPITVKIRMGTKDKQPTAEKLCQRLVSGGINAQEDGLGPCGVAAITLHGRSKQQRYSRSADWEYIAECATLITKLKAERRDATDTIREPDARDLAPTATGLPYFCGNGDILSHVDYNQHMDNAGVDSIMIGRGALIKPWIFEEIATNQYLDKSATERLSYIEQFVRNGLEYWGSDEIGVGTTRRFLLEWLSFSCRYVPIGILEYLPPKFGDRPPAFRGRNELETLLSSANYKDWIKISEMFLGPAHKDFQFQPKHKSNSYEIEAEG